MISWVYEEVDLPVIWDTPMLVTRNRETLRDCCEAHGINLNAHLAEIPGQRGFFRAARLREKGLNDYCLCAVGLDADGRWCAFELGIADAGGYAIGRSRSLPVSSPSDIVKRYAYTYLSLFKLQTEVVRLALKQQRERVAKIRALHGRVCAESDLIQHLRNMEEGEA
ncbi:MAG: hypothetical protein RDU25_01390 [Patescibacteria group bacterium]|nr:hypothetical protein [Patescibacteria group bacterium]